MLEKRKAVLTGDINAVLVNESNWAMVEKPIAVGSTIYFKLSNKYDIGYIYKINGTLLDYNCGKYNTCSFPLTPHLKDLNIE